MSKHSDIANAVISKQIDEMMEQERKNLVLLPIPGLEQECPFLSKDQMFEIALRIVVMTKISAMAGLN